MALKIRRDGVILGEVDGFTLPAGAAVPDDWLDTDDLVSNSTPGVQAISLLGPFHVEFDTPGIGEEEDGALLTVLDAGIVVLQVSVVVTADWEDGDSLGIYLGGDNYEAPDDDFTLLAPAFETASLNSVDGSGHAIGLSWASFGILTTEGALIAQCAGAFTEGEADIYVLIGTPV